MEERLNENLSYKEMVRYTNLPDTSVPDDADNANIPLDNIDYLKDSLNADNAGAHNSVFRGKNITKYFDDGTLWTKISSGTFEDLFVGDYIVKNNITWRIAGFDLFLNKGNPQIKKHHACIIPDSILTSSKMCNSGLTLGGYRASYIFTDTLPKVLADYITPVFENHVLEFKNLITTGVHETRYNRTGANTGCTNAWSWENRTIDLMNEVQVFGTIIWSSSGYDVALDNTQIPLFRLAQEFINSNSGYWLRAIVSKSNYVSVGSGNASPDANIESEGGIRPYFYID